MPHADRRRPLYWALLVFLAADLLAAVAYAYSLLFAVESPHLWVVSLVAVVALGPALLRMTDAVFAMASDPDIIPSMGEKIP